MKTKLIIICCTLLVTSCFHDEGYVRTGFMFDIVNDTDIEYENVKVTIGGIDNNGEFVGTQSYTLPPIRIRNNNSDSQYVAVDYNRWRPNLNLVKEISDKAYFRVQLEGKAPVLLYDSFDNDILVSAKITENGLVKNNYGGDLSINLYENGLIRGRFHEQQ
jgi:hypothetical protein